MTRLPKVSMHILVAPSTVRYTDYETIVIMCRYENICTYKVQASVRNNFVDNNYYK